MKRKKRMYGNKNSGTDEGRYGREEERLYRELLRKANDDERSESAMTGKMQDKN